MKPVSLADVRAAAERIRPFVVRTPLERSRALSERCGVDVWLKFECFQATGSFKLRGGLNALLLLDQPKQVVAASAGNHGLGVARAASLLGFSATVVVPETASTAKVEALRESGAELIQHGATYDEAEAEGLRLSRRRGLPFISPYNDPGVVAGGGTIALEVLEEIADAGTFLVPAGGGGLIGGIGVAAHGLNPRISVYGVQSVASPVLHTALKAGAIVPVEVKPSLADGLAGNIAGDSITFNLLQDHVRDVVLVDEDEIAEAMRWLLVHERVVVEGAAAVAIAALLHGRVPVDGPLIVVLTGRNVAASVLQQCLNGAI
jgi:threonine dehydratase